MISPLYIELIADYDSVREKKSWQFCNKEKVHFEKTKVIACILTSVTPCNFFNDI